MGLRELTLDLEDAEHLFAARAPDVWAGKPELPSGMDQLRNELISASARHPDHGGDRASARRAPPDLERATRQAVDRYCAIGIKQVENELMAIRREGTRALIIGVILLAIFLGLSEAVLHSSFPDAIRTSSATDRSSSQPGSEWYPLEMLIYAGRPHKLENNVLRAIREMEIVVRASD